MKSFSLLLISNYVYDPDLDSKGKIIGGEWNSAKRPDFYWTVGASKSYSGFFSRLTELLGD